MNEELERGPFGRNLSLLVHRLPRSSRDWDWEIERGFHLEVLTDSLFALNLRPRSEEGNLAIGQAATGPGLSRLLIWQKGLKDELGWSDFAASLKGQPWQAGVILSNSAERGPATTSYLSRRAHFKGLSCAVVQVFQDSPPATFFTVEKNLFALGRVGRRMERNARLRRLLPW